MHQPYVAAELALLAQRQKNGRRQHERRGGRMIVVSAASGQARSPAAVLLVEMINHVSRVVMIRHDDRPAAILAGNQDQQIALARLTVLVLEPSFRPGK